MYISFVLVVGCGDKSVGTVSEIACICGCVVSNSDTEQAHNHTEAAHKRNNTTPLHQSPSAPIDSHTRTNTQTHRHTVKAGLKDAIVDVDTTPTIVVSKVRIRVLCHYVCVWFIAFMYVYMCAYVCMCVCTYMYVHMRRCMRVYVCVYVCLCMYVLAMVFCVAACWCFGVFVLLPLQCVYGFVCLL